MIRPRARVSCMLVNQLEARYAVMRFVTGSAVVATPTHNKLKGSCHRFVARITFALQYFARRNETVYKCLP